MKTIRQIAGKWGFLYRLVWVGILMAGCSSPKFQSPEQFGLPNTNAEMGRRDTLRVGDQLLVTYSGSVSDKMLPDHTETIKEDGTITPPVVGAILAAGKTPGALQSELQTNYNRYYTHLTVTVVPQGRFYFVTGEVKKPGPEPYLGETDIIKAISAAGDFTDFAKKSNVKITRADGRVEYVDVQKILDEPQSFDVPIYPGDKIWVPRRFL